jgi:hypothetical protein
MFSFPQLPREINSLIHEFRLAAEKKDYDTALAAHKTKFTKVIEQLVSITCNIKLSLRILDGKRRIIVHLRNPNRWDIITDDKVFPLIVRDWAVINGEVYMRKFKLDKPYGPSIIDNILYLRKK